MPLATVLRLNAASCLSFGLIFLAGSVSRNGPCLVDRQSWGGVDRERSPFMAQRTRSPCAQARRSAVLLSRGSGMGCDDPRPHLDRALDHYASRAGGGLDRGLGRWGHGVDAVAGVTEITG